MTQGARSAALAVWVKTLGWSPVKTRLAATVGTAAAEAFYALAVRAVEDVVRAAADALGPDALTPYWAVAEPDAEALATWTGFGTVGQGAGGLGERLSHVYDALRARHERVLFIGADAPQLDAALLVDAIRRLTPRRGPIDAEDSGVDFVVGPAEDGGFYLFGGRRAMSRAAWTEVPYSDPGTLIALMPHLMEIGSVATLPVAFDVDTADELARLGATLASASTLLPAQRSLARWIDARTVDAQTVDAQSVDARRGGA